MIDVKQIIIKRIMFFVVCLILCCYFIISFFNNELLPIFMDYGKYQSNNMMVSVLNIAIEEQLSESVKNNIIVETEDRFTSVNFNTDILNSISHNIVNRANQILNYIEEGCLDKKTLEKLNINVNKEYLEKGIVYEVPFSMAFKNFLLGNFNFNIPVRYKLIGKIEADIVSSVDSYGINNALVSIVLQIKAKSKILIPMKTDENEINLDVPLVVRVIQGDVPDYYFGSQVIGGVNK